LVQKTASELKSPITDKEMFKTFNMGWGFAVILEKADTNKALDILNKLGVESEQIGHVTNSKGIRVFHKGKKIILD
jgi:phosphoribosylformylglycinamidine cyclo-ligase